jgi:hypothetical protein
MRREKETAAVGFFNFFMVSLFVLGRVILAQKPEEEEPGCWLSLFMVVLVGPFCLEL